MKLSRSFLFILLFVSASCTVFAQKTVITKVAKFKPPAVQTFLGANTNGATVTKEEADQLITLPLKITDAKNNTFAINSYQFLYREKSVIRDEETGKKQTTFTTKAGTFTATPLPKLWIDNIKGGFQKDEELYFFDIVVKDKTGGIFFAPNLKITIQ